MQKYMDISQIHKVREIGRGSESIVYELSDPDYVYKEYKENLPLSLLKSKMLNINALMDISELYKYGYTIDYMIHDEKNNPEKLLGVMKKLNYSKSIFKFRNDKRIMALHTSKDMLEGLEGLHVMYYDPFPDNIRHDGNPKDLTFDDMDSACVTGIKSYYKCYKLLNYYLKLGGMPGFEAVKYAFNLATYCFLAGISIDDINRTQNYNEILSSNNLDTPHITSFCKEMFSGKVDQIADHEYLINIINDEITVEDNKFVFKK